MHRRAEPVMQCVMPDSVEPVQINLHKLLLELPQHLLALQMTDESGLCRNGAIHDR